MLRTVLLSSWLILFIKSVQSDTIETVEVDATGSTKVSDDPNALEVVFENQSGRTIELWSDDDYAVYFKATLDDTKSVTIDLSIGDRFYFTPPKSGGSKEHVLYQKIIKSTKNVVLYEKYKMQDVIRRDGLGCDGANCKIIFDNKSLRPLNVYWDNGKDGVFQGLIKKASEMVQYTSVGHRFFFTPNNNDRTDRLYTITITADTDIVTLD